MIRTSFKILHIPAVLLFSCVFAYSQIATSISINKREFIAGESVIAEVIVTNHTGQELTLAGTTAQPWLTFVVTNNQGNPVSITKPNTFGAMKIRAGESLAKRVDLTEYFILNSQGNFAVFASITDPQKRFSSATTNRVQFNLSPGRTYWSQKIGISDSKKVTSTRDMKVLTFSNGQKNQIYAQVSDGASGVPIRTFLLGDMLTLRKPMVTLDGQRRMHVMFLSTPSMWVHCEIDSDGKMVNREIHQSPGKGDPVMMAYGDGSVRVVNSVVYDPELVAKERAKIRKISDRPNQ